MFLKRIYEIGYRKVFSITIKIKLNKRMSKPPPDPIFVIRNETNAPSCLKTVENNNSMLIERYFC